MIIWVGIICGDDKNDERYEGEIENGLPNGQGTITFKVGGQLMKGN